MTSFLLSRFGSDWFLSQNGKFVGPMQLLPRACFILPLDLEGDQEVEEESFDGPSKLVQSLLRLAKMKCDLLKRGLCLL
jgi:hypothetical protein